MNELLTVLGSGSPPSLYNERLGANTRHLSGYLLDEHTLIDASAGIARRIEAAGVPPELIRNVVVSHMHSDHCQIDSFLQEQWAILRAQHPQEPHSVTIFGPPGIVARYTELDGGAYFRYLNGPKVAPYLNVQWREYENEVPLQLDDDTVLTPHRVIHGDLKEAYALRFEDGKAVTTYSGDTGECEGVRKAADHATLFICEAGEPIGGKDHGPHLTPRGAGRTARDASVERLMLTHLPGTSNDWDTLISAAETFNGPVGVCHDGQLIPIVNLFTQNG